MKEVYGVIVAAGKGKRMGAALNKQFLLIKDYPVLYYTIKAFSDSKHINKIILVAAEGEVDYCKSEIVEKYNFSKVEKIVAGGTERMDSVYNALEAIENCSIVLIHDGARPIITDCIIEQGIEFAEKYGASACGVTPKDTIKTKGTDGFSTFTHNRHELFSVQTPQCFKYDIIMKCHKAIKGDIERLPSLSKEITDDTSVVERYGYKVYLYEGDYRNIKITTPEDIIIAENFI